MEEYELTIMNLVVGSGSARSYAMEAIALAKNGEMEAAAESMKMAEEEMSKAHLAQTNLIQQEAGGKKVEVSLLMVHAQDHLMTCMVVIDLAREIIDLHKLRSN